MTLDAAVLGSFLGLLLIGMGTALLFAFALAREALSQRLGDGLRDAPSCAATRQDLARDGEEVER